MLAIKKALEDNMMIPTKESFSISVEERANAEGLSLLEALVEMVEEFGISDQEIKKYISPTLRDKLALENGIVHNSSIALPL